MTVALVFILVTALNAVIEGWALMVLLGVIHGFAPQVPALGYGPSFIIAALANLAIGMVRR